MKTIMSIFFLFVLSNFTMSNTVINTDTIKSNPDTLAVNFTYWWPSGGPFTGLCGDPYSLVFTGTITKLYRPLKPVTTSDSITILYTPQTGIIKINEVKFKKSPGEGTNDTTGTNYNGQQYFSSNCFSESRLREGDKVIVFIYSYEGEYSIPDGSILRIINFDDYIVSSIDKYIKNDQDPLVIRGDTLYWSKYGLDKALKQIIDCRLSNKK